METFIVTWRIYFAFFSYCMGNLIVEEELKEGSGEEGEDR
jgi:hypothetical protein